MSEEHGWAPVVRFVVMHPWLTAAVSAVAVTTGAALVVVSGIVPTKASSGHWAVTTWVLDFAKRRSVATHSLGIQAPPLDDDAQIFRGAAHYELGCSPCHGRPGTGIPPVMAAMTPGPPELQAQVARYSPQELFFIVKHGIKFTGMPAWPAQQRDDEVWAVVAFLRKIPALDAAEYRRLASEEGAIQPEVAPNLPAVAGREPPRAVRDLCWRCHGLAGTGRGSGAFPSLAGQRSAYIYASLRAFADRRRFSGTMGGIAATLSDEAMRSAAEYYESLAPRRAGASDDPPATARGAAIARSGIPDQDIPACAECHGPTARPKNPAYPKLAAQHVRYLTSQLQLLRERRRGGSPNVRLMHVFVDRLRPGQMRDVALYYGSAAAQSVRGLPESAER